MQQPNILLVAEMQELEANPSGLTAGVVIEASVDEGKGVIATVLVQRATLKYFLLSRPIDFDLRRRLFVSFAHRRPFLLQNRFLWKRFFY